MRLFAAVDLDSAALRVAAAVAEGITRQLSHGNSAGGLRWVLPSHLHITLRFLGETSYEQADSIRLALQPPWESETLLAGFTGLNLFLLVGRPRVVGLGIDRGQDQLAALKAELDRRLGSVGLAPSARPFLAHLILGRIGRKLRGSGSDVRELVSAYRLHSARWLVDHFTLYESRLSHSWASYYELESISLRPASGKRITWR